MIRTLREAAKSYELETPCVTNDGGMDANWIVAHGIPTVTLDVGQRFAHTPEEHLELDRFQTAIRLAITLAGKR